MLALYLIAAHLVGDFLLQNRWQAAHKLDDRLVRTTHVLFYGFPFIPIVVLYGRYAWSGAAFLVALWVLHFATDSRRFQSNIGDVVQWRIDWWNDKQPIYQEWLNYLIANHSEIGVTKTSTKGFLVNDKVARWPTPNPWSTLPIMVDQTLHICQLALLGGLFLR